MVVAIGLISVELPNSLTNIGSSTFAWCRSLTSVKINNNAIFDTSTSKSYTFMGCTSLTSIEIPDGVTSIDEFYFWDCSGLNNIKIPASVTTIGQEAFNGCSNLTTVNYTGTQEQWAAININATGNDSLKNATIVYNYTGE